MIHLDETIPCLADMTDDEKASRYWTPSEFNAIKLNARLDTRDVRKNQLPGIRHIEDTWQRAAQLAMQNDDDIGQDVTTHARELCTWTALGTGRGLEKYVSQRHRQERSDIIKHSIYAVVSLYQQDGPVPDTNKLADLYASYTRASAIYARILGAADELAIPEHAVVVRPLKTSLTTTIAMDIDVPALVSLNDSSSTSSSESSSSASSSIGLGATSRRGLLTRSKSPNASRKRSLLTTVVC